MTDSSWAWIDKKFGIDKEYGCDETGYGKPPKRTQFQPGRSGNPKGRPKGSKNVAILFNQALNEKVVVKANGRAKKVTKATAILTQLVNKAAQGDHRSIALVLSKFPGLERDLCDPRNDPQKRKGGLTPEAVKAMYDIVLGDVLKPK